MPGRTRSYPIMQPNQFKSVRADESNQARQNQLTGYANHPSTGLHWKRFDEESDEESSNGQQLEDDDDSSFAGMKAFLPMTCLRTVEERRNFCLEILGERLCLRHLLQKIIFNLGFVYEDRAMTISRRRMPMASSPTLGS